MLKIDCGGLGNGEGEMRSIDERRERQTERKGSDSSTGVLLALCCASRESSAE